MPFQITHQKTGTALLHKSFHGNVNVSQGLTRIPCLAKPQLMGSLDAYEKHPYKSLLTLAFLVYPWRILFLNREASSYCVGNTVEMLT